MLTVVVVLCCWLGLLAGLLTIWNLLLFRVPPPVSGAAPLAVSVIVPARNEEAAILPCIEALLQSRDVALELIVVDDNSSDRTASLVQSRAEHEPRLRLLRAPPLRPGWSGKMNGCAAGAAAAAHPILLFLDVDVHMRPDGVARMAGWLRDGDLALGSAFPRERAETFGEQLLIPLIHTMLLGYLPIFLARRSESPSFGAGCGQIFVADAALYRFAGGHGLVRGTWHDGVMLPRAFRRCGLRTDICDATPIAACRMYEGFLATWRGLGKNANEGMATKGGLPVWSVLLLGGQVMPFVLLLAAMRGLLPWDLPAASVAALLLSHIASGIRFRQGAPGILLQPVGMVILLAIQWSALIGRMRGRQPVWRGRSQVAS